MSEETERRSVEGSARVRCAGRRSGQQLLTFQKFEAAVRSPEPSPGSVTGQAHLDVPLDALHAT